RAAPAAEVSDAAELAHELLDLLGRADRIAAYERDPVDDSIREKGVAGGREEVALVLTQSEERQRVAAARRDDTFRLRTRVRALLDFAGDRTQPQVERPRHQRGGKD